MYVVYHEIRDSNGIERRFYGMYPTEEQACEVAKKLGNDYAAGIFRCVCKEEEAASLNITRMKRRRAWKT